MKTVLLIFLFIHGGIHLIGFLKAFKLAEIDQLSENISKPLGLLWLTTTLLFTIAALFFILKKDWWSIIALTAIVLSQILIVIYWKDAKFGTIANILILIPAILSLASWNFENRYRNDVSNSISTTNFTQEIITQSDLDPLPDIVQKYLKYVGVVGKPKIKNVKITFEGKMREKGKDWFQFTSEQFNFFDSPTRLFFMKANVNGLPTSGYHEYKDGEACMQIRLLSLFTVVDISADEMFKTETVTFFNDLCLFAPGALINPKIGWKTIDSLSVNATFSNNDTSISADLFFNESGQLINFISNDRYSVSEMKTFPFSTPVKNYKDYNGFQLPSYGEATWHYPDEEFIYGKFNLKTIEYNVQKLK